MAKKLGAKAMMKLDVLDQARRQMQRIASLVEQFAAARSGQDQFLMNIIQTSTRLQRVLMTNGMGTMADTANQIIMTSRRGGSQSTKGRNLRELIASLNAAIERAEKATRTAATAEDEKEDD